MMRRMRSIYSTHNTTVLNRLSGSGRLNMNGIGHPLVDLVVQCESQFMDTIGIVPGTTNHIQRQELEPILEILPKHTRIPGGGAANTCRMAAILGGRCSISGCVGDDCLGDWYENQLASEGVILSLRHLTGFQTGIYCTFIHPDGKRTLVVAPGAAMFFDAEDVAQSIFGEGSVLLAEGFLARKPASLEAVLKRGSDSGMVVAMDLGSRDLVMSNHEFLARIIPAYCDIVFANEAEFHAFTGYRKTEEARGILPDGILFIVKKGERGAVSIIDGEYTESAVRPLEMIDETGAGDAFTAGFLTAFAAGFTIAECLRRGNNLAGSTVLVPGASLSLTAVTEAWDRQFDKN